MRGTLPAVTALAVCGALGLVSGSAVAGGPADTTVTIKAEGTDLSGTVKSPRPMTCAEGRNVVVFKQIGTRGGGDDENFASDTAGLSGGVYRWSTGNTGTPGKFYAKVKAIPGCKGDTSPTIRARRN